MTDATIPHQRVSLTAPDARTKKRAAAEKRFRAYGLIAIGFGVSAVINSRLVERLRLQPIGPIRAAQPSRRGGH
jgi:hypothetical protein